MRHPSHAELERIADDVGISFAEGELEKYAEIVADGLDLVEDVAETPRPRHPPTDYEHTDRSPGYDPDEAEDPYNAWITKCRVEGADDGPLSGMTVGLKDNVSLAGIELTNGSKVMEGYVPSADATVVTRLLDAGATIVGKNNMWNFSSGASDYGPAGNPKAPEYSIGGSSSGGATAVAAGEVDIAIGGDQGGSIRMPASCGGIVGLKPTFGLIPYTGIMGADPTIDYTGPMTRTVEDAALALAVLAGRDGLDPRQPHDLEVGDYTGALDGDISGVTVAVLEEGFGQEASHPEVDATVREAIADLDAMGAEITELSVPAHTSIADPRTVVSRYGTAQVLKQNGGPTGFDGWYDAGLVEYLGRALDGRKSDLPASVKSRLLLTEFLQRNDGGAVYARAQNQLVAQRQQYDEALADVDALVMPTMPDTPPAHGEARGLETMVEEGTSTTMSNNTAPFNASKHPALTVPCGEAEGAPVGMMLVGSRFDEATLFELGYAYEQFVA